MKENDKDDVAGEHSFVAGRKPLSRWTAEAIEVSGSAIHTQAAACGFRLIK